MSTADPVTVAKREIRSRVLAARALIDPETERSGADRLADTVVALISDRGVRTVAAYVSMPAEPGTRPLIERLHADGVRVLLPVLLDDLDLDWASYRPGEWRPGRLGLVEPDSPRLGLEAVLTAGVIVCPGVAGAPSGARIGRGGGSYDRVLARALPTSLRCLLLYDDEVLPDVPTAPHDQRVDVIVTPARTLSATSPRARF